MDATVQAVGVQAVAETPKVVSPLDGIIDAIAAAVIARLDLASLVKVQLQDVTVFGKWARSSANNVFDEKIDEAAGDYSSVMGAAMRKIAEDIYETRIGFLLEDCSKTMRQSAAEVVDQKIGEAVEDGSSAMGEAMRKIAEDTFDEKIDDSLENYDCSEAIQKALDDKDFESDMDSKIEKAFEEVDWAEELRNLRFRAV